MKVPKTPPKAILARNHHDHPGGARSLGPCARARGWGQGSLTMAKRYTLIDVKLTGIQRDLIEWALDARDGLEREEGDDWGVASIIEGNLVGDVLGLDDIALRLIEQLPDMARQDPTANLRTVAHAKRLAHKLGRATDKYLEESKRWAAADFAKGRTTMK